MHLAVKDNGVNNRIIATESTLLKLNGDILFNGDNNQVFFGDDSYSRRINFQFGSDSLFSCGINCNLSALEIYTISQSNIQIGDNCGFTWHTKIYCHEAKNVFIGNGCLIASETMLTVSDMHSIIDVETNERINHAEDIYVGDRVWLGAGCFLLKGSTIGSGSIIGAHSVVTGELPQLCLCVGSPARIVKKNVTWTFELIKK